MKLITFLLSMLLLSAFLSAGAQINNQNYQTVSETGVWIDQNGKKLGSVDANGFLKDSSGISFGSVQKIPNNPGLFAFKDAEGNELATILEDGTVRNLRSIVLYTLFPANALGYCRVYDEAGRVVGMVHKNYMFSGVCLMESQKIAASNRSLQQSAR